MIPKIIFQTGPSDRNKWKEIWFQCRSTWKNLFPKSEWSHIFWGDLECEDFVKTEYPQYYEMYMSYDKIIQKSDVVRYLFLHKYGGIYADLDYMAIKNFYQDLPENMVSVCESPFNGWEKVQNSLMASNPGNPFWIKVMEEVRDRVDEEDILRSTGPILLGDVMDKNLEVVNTLPSEFFNPKPGTPDFSSTNIVAKHYGTRSWVNSTTNSI